MRKRFLFLISFSFIQTAAVCECQKKEAYIFMNSLIIPNNSFFLNSYQLLIYKTQKTKQIWIGTLFLP